MWQTQGTKPMRWGGGALLLGGLGESQPVRGGGGSMWLPGHQQRPLGSECLRRPRGLPDGVWQCDFGPGHPGEGHPGEGHPAEPAAPAGCAGGAGAVPPGGVYVWPFMLLVFEAGRLSWACCRNVVSAAEANGQEGQRSGTHSRISLVRSLNTTCSKDDLGTSLITVHAGQRT